MKRARAKAVRVVPSLVLTASFVGVVPACALVSCSDGQGNGNDVWVGGDVAAEAFGFPDGVAYCCFDAMGVADVAFKPDGADANTSDAPEDVSNDGANE